MTDQFSFTKYEHEIIPEFRAKMNKAESAEDVKNSFIYTARELLSSILESKVAIGPEDLSLQPGNEPYYRINPALLESKEFSSIWNDSDLPRVLQDLAETASRRLRHLGKHPEKTDAKIRKSARTQP